MMRVRLNFESDIECPYCGIPQREPQELGDGDNDGTTECERCEKKFRWFRYIETCYETEKVETDE